jgi:hypothetical protein
LQVIANQDKFMGQGEAFDELDFDDLTALVYKHVVEFLAYQQWMTDTQTCGEKHWLFVVKFFDLFEILKLVLVKGNALNFLTWVGLARSHSNNSILLKWEHLQEFLDNIVQSHMGETSD